MSLRQLVHLGTLSYGYMLLAFEEPKSVQITTRAMSETNMEQKCGFKKNT